MAAHATRIFGQPTRENRGSSFAVSVAITAALFVLAFGAMRSLPSLALNGRSTEKPVAIQLPQIAVPTPPTKPVSIDHAATRARPAVPTAEPATVGVPTAPPITAPIATPTTIPGASRDSSDSGTGKPAADAALNSSLRAGTAGIGTAAAPAWTKSAEHVGNTPVERDSILRARMVQIPAQMLTHQPTGKEKAEMQASQLAAALLQARTTSSGNSRDLVHLQGKGKDGVGAVSAPGMASVPFTLFSSGPTAEQRKKNEAIDADYQARLRRLEDSVLSKRDRRLLADSLRLDSLRRDSLARRPKTPPPDSIAHD